MSEEINNGTNEETKEETKEEQKEETNDKTKRVGRPLSYGHILLELKDDELYSPGGIARLGQELGYLDEVEDRPWAEKRQLVRHTLARYRINNGFPVAGDGVVNLKGQGPTSGWAGWRWKARMEEGEKKIARAEAKRLKELHDLKGRVGDE